MPDIKELKKALRAEFKQRRREITFEDRIELDRKICDAVLSLDEFKCADTVLMFYPSFGEPNVLTVAEKAFEMGKSVAFPICDTQTHTMRFLLVTSIEELAAGSYSIPEPRADAHEFVREGKVFCIVPALSFDRFGYRLGYGAGYYDRFLSDADVYAVGVIYSALVCDELPRGRFDVSVQSIVTERGETLINGEKI